jgi:hypothetical protein
VSGQPLLAASPKRGEKRGRIYFPRLGRGNTKLRRSTPADNVSHAVAEGGHGLDTRKWGEQAIRLAVKAATEFEAKARAKHARQEAAAQRLAAK